jgi:sialic acid synthase SpsE
MYAGRDIKKGKVVTREDIVLKGPAYGIYPKYMDIVVGQKARKDIKKDTPLTWEIIGNE